MKCIHMCNRTSCKSVIIQNKTFSVCWWDLQIDIKVFSHWGWFWFTPACQTHVWIKDTRWLKSFLLGWAQAVSVVPRMTWTSWRTLPNGLQARKWEVDQQFLSLQHFTSAQLLEEDERSERSVFFMWEERPWKGCEKVFSVPPILPRHCGMLSCLCWNASSWTFSLSNYCI